MHPYRTLSHDVPPVAGAGIEPGQRLAFRVMTMAGVVEVASGWAHGAPAALPTLFGAACCVAGLVWLRRHRVR